MPGDVINCVGDLLRSIDESDIVQAWTPHVQLWYRGHGDATWKLEPGVYRAGLPADEDEQILYERHLTQDFLSFSAKLRNEHRTNAELYFIQQHYSLPTRLLDWTGNPLAALFFALQPTETDGELIMLDSYQFKGGHKTVPYVGRLSRALEAVFNWNNDVWPGDIMAVRPPDQDFRIVAQRGFFTFHPKGLRYLDETSNPSIVRFPIPRTAKATIREELDRLNVNEFTMYGDLDNLARWLKRIYSGAPARQRLKSKGPWPTA